MNKTVNINLAGIFFHIDEDAYLKLQRYLEAIKRSFTDSQGRNEIIADIEARISELFNERVKHNKQVIGIKEVDEVISIMGQPEDYLVDEEIFEDEPNNTHQKSKTSKKLFRDTDNSYIGGVSSGLSHYLGIDVLWIRILWCILIFGFGTGFILYILLWIFIPEATTTSEKIQMTGEKVNISNIEKKIRDGFDNVSETVKSIDLQKHTDKLKEGIEQASDNISETVKRIPTNKIKSSSKSFFDTIADVFSFFFKIIGKLVGVLLILSAASGVIALTIGLIIGTFVDTDAHFFDPEFSNLATASGAPFWLISLLVFFIAAIPLFVLFYLGLKILVSNLKSIGNVAKFTLIGLWLLSIIALATIAVKQGLSYKEKAFVVKTEVIENLTANDTIKLSMVNNDYYAERFYRDYDFEEGYTSNGEKIIYSQGVRLIVKQTKESNVKIKVKKSARGINYNAAKNRASNIDFEYFIDGNHIKLNNHFIVPNNNTLKGQEAEVTIYLPEGSILYAHKNTYKYHSNSSHYYNDILEHGMENHFLKVEKNALNCLDCEENTTNNNFKVKVNIDNEDAKLKINNNEFQASNKNSKVIIDDNGVKAKSENVNVTIDEDGIEITSEKK